MPLRFCANLSFLFQEQKCLLDRYQAARDAGFKAVESAFPVGYSIEQVVKAKTEAQVDQELINIHPGNADNGELGLACLPCREKDFEECLHTTVKYANALGCKRIHIMSGKSYRNMVDAAMGECYENNLKTAVEILTNHGITGLIEPINSYSVPNYYMNSFEKGLEIVKKINSPYLKLQVDLFHLQIMKGNLTRTLTEYFPHIGHIQVAQVPDRHEPTSSGEINYPYIFSLLEKLEYSGWIGLEYFPVSNTKEGLSWITELGYKL